MDDTLRNAALIEILRDRDQVLLRRLEVRAQILELQHEDEWLRSRLIDLKAAGRVFNQVVAGPLDAKFYESREILEKVMREARNGAAWVPGQSSPTSANKITNRAAADEDPSPTPDRLRVKDHVVNYLRQAGENGTTAASIRERLLKEHGIRTHEKTVGMTLYRLLRVDQLARREGRTWFFVPPSGETKNPGAAAPGSLL